MEFPELPGYIIEGGKIALIGVSYYLTKKEFKKYLENNAQYDPYRKYIEYVEKIGEKFNYKLFADETNRNSFFENIDFDKIYRDLINKIVSDTYFKGEPEYTGWINKVSEFLNYIYNPRTFEEEGVDPSFLKTEWEKGSLMIIHTFFINLSKLFGLLKKDNQFKDDVERNSFLSWMESLTEYFTTQVKEKYPELLSE